MWAQLASGACEGLSPGSYPAVAGATIAAGATGSVVYDGSVYQAVNQSQCDVYTGVKVGLHVSPNCEMFFVPCVCECDSEPDCCDRSVAVCVNGDIRIIPINNGESEWLLPCCDNAGETEGPKKYILHLTCELYEGTEQFAIRAYYTVVPVDFEREENDWLLWSWLNWDALCDDPSIDQVDVQELAGAGGGGGGGNCRWWIVASMTAQENQCQCTCPPCGSNDPDPSECCDRSLWFCINEVSKEIPLVGGNETFDVSACCNCEAAALQLTTSCVNGIPFLGWFYSCGEITGNGTISLEHFCTSNAGQILTIESPCFIQIQATTQETICAECVYEPTTTGPPTVEP